MISEQVCLMRLRFERYISHHRATQMIISRILKKYADLDGNNGTCGTSTEEITQVRKLCFRPALSFQHPNALTNKKKSDFCTFAQSQHIVI